MSKFVVNGGRSLCGQITVGGSKNAALPIIFSTLVTEGVSALYGVPDIADVRVALDIIKDFGARCERLGDALYINTKNLRYCKPCDESVSKIRASTYLLGACLARFGRVHICSFGGCNFENRPIDMHVGAALSLGAKVACDELFAQKLVGGDIFFDKISVGATVNALLMAVRAEGITRIFGYAREPHIRTLISFLRTAGAHIDVTTEYIEVVGTFLHSGVATVIPDMIEAGTYLALSLATSSKLDIVGVNRADLAPFLDVAVRGGACLSFFGATARLEGALDESVDIETAPHPAFPTDLQPQTASLLAAFCGGSITEGVWLSRFGYLEELAKFGVQYSREGNRAIIYPSKLTPARARVPDLRGGAAILIAALVAPGQSVIDSAEIIDRGYEKIVEKLRSVGADIEKTS